MWFPTKISLSYYDTLQSQIDCGRHSETAMVVTISEVGGICCLWYIAPSLNLCAINCGLSLLKHQTHITVIHFFCFFVLYWVKRWHCLGLGYETMVCAVCLSIFLWIRDMARLLRGTFVSWWYLPRIWPSVTDMQHYYHARYPTDDWHLAYMFSLVYFFRRCVSGGRVSPFC